MSNRTAALRDLAAALTDHDAVADAWVAKSFSDQLVVVDVQAGETLPASVEDRLTARGLRGANEVYDLDYEDESYMGLVDGTNRHRFVDVRTRGEHQSYVVE